MDLPEGKWDMLFMSDSEGGIQDGRGNTQELLGIPLPGIIGSSVLQLVSEPDLDLLKGLLASGFAHAQAVIKFRTHGKWEEAFYTTVNKLGIGQPFWLMLRQVPPEEGGGVMLAPEVAEKKLLSKEEFTQEVQHHSGASFIDVDGLEEVEEDSMKMDRSTSGRKAEEEHLRNAYRSLVQAVVNRGENKVSRVADNRFAVLHNGNYEETHVVCNIKRSLKQAEIEDFSVSAESLDVEEIDASGVAYFEELISDFECNGVKVIADYNPPSDYRRPKDTDDGKGLRQNSEERSNPKGWVKVDLQDKNFRENL